jgi:plasmid stability protein
MASITIRKLDDGLKARLRVKASRAGRSREDEAREILRTALAEPDRVAQYLAERIRLRFRAVGGGDLDIPPRERMRRPPEFGP